MTIEELASALYQYIDVKVQEIKTQLFYNKPASQQVDLAEFEAVYMSEYSGQKPLKHETFSMFIDLLEKLGVGDVHPFGLAKLDSVEALDQTDEPGGYSINLPENHPILGSDHFGLLLLAGNATDLRVQVAFVHLSGKETIWIRSGESLSWGDWERQGADKVDKNEPITAATKTKVTYDSKGLVTSGEDATTQDIEPSTNRNYVTDTEKTAAGNLPANTNDVLALEMQTRQAADENLQTQVEALASGTPKGSYPTLVALEAAFPTGTTGIYVVTADGHWYFWNGSAWTDGGVYQAALDVVGELGTSETKVINQQKNTEELNSKVSTNEQPLTEQKQYQARKNINSIFLKLERSTNILNKSTSTIKTYINTSGVLAVADEDVYETTDFILWKEYESLVSGKNGMMANLFTAAQYDENKTFIAGTHIWHTPAVNTMAKNANAKYFRVSYITGNVNQINFGSSILPYAENLTSVSKEEGDVSVIFKPDTLDVNLNNIFAKKLDTTSKDGALILQKNGSIDFDIINKITPSGGVWAAASSYNNKWLQVHYIGKTKKIINRISIPIVRNLYANSVFTDGITVRLFNSGIELLTKVIPFSVVSTYNSLTAASPLASFFYDIDVFPFELDVDEVLFVGIECNAATDKISMVYTMNTASDANEYSRNYTSSGDTAGTIINATTQPALPASAGFYRVIKFSFVDYISKSILQKTDETAVYPDKIYTVCNDIVTTDSGFNSRNYAACLYADHFFKLSAKRKLKFASTDSDKLPIFAPIDPDNDPYNGGVNVKTTTVADTLTGNIEDVAISLSHISTKASVGSAQFPKVLVIGDSVTNGFLADKPTSVTLNNPTTYWSYARKLFYLDFLDATSGHSCLFLGKQTNRNFIVNGQTVKSFAEGRGGWTTRNYLYDASLGGYTNYFYDSSKPTVKFSLAKYLADYKTLADDGVTRLQAGSTAGTLVTDVNAHDVCTPTHIVIQTGFNDTEANWAVDVQLMIDSIKAEFPDMIIIISTIDAAGTYMPENYPMFDAASINLLGDTLHAKMYNLVAAAKSLESVEDKIFYCPNYFIQPTAFGVAFRNVDFPESIANSQFIFKTEHGAGNNYHPNTYAHAAWGYQLYSLIKYTLTL